MYNDIDFLLFDALRQTSQNMRAHKPHTDGARPAKREIILAILLQNGDMRQNQLAQAFRVSPSTLSEMIDRLEADGMIERVTDPADRRATLLTLTERGKSRSKAIKDSARKDFSRWFRNLSEEEKRQLISLLQKIAVE